MAICEKCFKNFNATLSHCPYCKTVVRERVKNFSFSEVLVDHEALQVAEEKKQLRKTFLALRNEMTKKQVKSKTKAIHKHLFNTEAYQQAKTIFIYLSANSELDTTNIIRRAWKDKKNVALPRVSGRHQMDFIAVHDLKNLETSAFGIQEPLFDEAHKMESDAQTLVIVPGLVFDKNHYRVGYGGGFYDSFLKEATVYKTVALCYQFQVIERVPTSTFDVPVDCILTEKGEE